jgi:hypothetical protein
VTSLTSTEKGDRLASDLPVQREMVEIVEPALPLQREIVAEEKTSKPRSNAIPSLNDLVEETAPNERRSTRQRAMPTRLRDCVVGLAAYRFIGCAHAMDVAKLTAGTPEAYTAMSVLDDLTCTVEYNDPAVFQASARARMGKSKKGNNPDFPTYHQAMQTPEASEWIAAMDKEISTLNDLKTWRIVRRADVLAQGRRVLKSTWAFRKKRLPNREISKYEARFCVRGDIQERICPRGAMVVSTVDVDNVDRTWPAHATS